MSEQTIAKIHAAMQRGEITCRQLVETCLNRIEAYDQYGPKLNAVLRVNPRALQLATERDETLRRQGMIGPLHGIPILLKDNIETADMKTTAGAVCLKEQQPAQDAFLVRKLKDAGAIILAKVNLHEFAVWGETVSSLGGQTLNPYDLSRTPGGSSGGTGAGVAAGFGVAGIGTDTVNSVRSPASANSLVGIRPTTGLVSRSGLIPYSDSQDTAGPIARCVSDAALLLDVMVGYDPEDARTAYSVGQTGPGSYLAATVNPQLKGRRIGLLRSLFGEGEESAQVNAAVEACISAMRSLGAEFVELTENIDSAGLARDVSVHLHELERDLDSYLRRLGPEAPVHSLRDVLACGRFHPGIGDNLRQAIALDSEGLEYLRRLREQEQLRRNLLKIMAQHKLDAFVFPHQQGLVVKIGQTQVGRNGVLASVVGFPSIAIPAGFSTPTTTAPLGVPIGIEFIGRPWSEYRLLEIAAALEQARPVRVPPQL